MIENICEELRNPQTAQAAGRTLSARFKGAELEDVMNQLRDGSVFVESEDAAMSHSSADCMELFESKTCVKQMWGNDSG